MIPNYLGAPVAPALAGGGPALNPLAAALMQGGMPDQGGGASPNQTGAPLLQTGGTVPGSIPIGAPTNQFGTQPAVPIGRPAVPPAGVPAPAPVGPTVPPLAPSPPPTLGPAAVRPFGFGSTGAGGGPVGNAAFGRPISRGY